MCEATESALAAAAVAAVGSSDGAGAPAPGARPRTPIELAASALRGRSTVLVVWGLFWGGKSFFQLLRDLDGIGQKALQAELGELERKGIVRRERSPDPSRCLFVLTSAGHRLKLAVGVLYEWGLHALNDSELAGKLTAEKRPGSRQPPRVAAL